MQVTALCRSVDGWDEVDDVAKILEVRRDPRRLVWAEADVAGGTENDVRELASGFALDELAVEDALNPRQRPKLEPYPGHLLVVVYELEEIDDQLEPRQIAAFIGHGFVVVLHHGASQLMQEARRRLSAEDAETPTVDSLVHVLLDSIVDDYEAKAEQLAVDVEDLEMQALAAARAADRDDLSAELPSQYLLYTVKQQVSMLRRFALPMSRAVERLAHTGSEAPDESELQFRDVEDHLIRLAAQVKSIDELAGGVLDLSRSIQGDRLNDVQKKLSGWAAVFAVPALLFGLYGTNIGLAPHSLGGWGEVFLIGLSLVCGGAVYAFFKRRDWI
jgi:magnesium transporter